MTFTMVVSFFVVMVLAVAILAAVYIFAQKRTSGRTQKQPDDFAARQESALWASATLLKSPGVIAGGGGNTAGWALYDLSLQVTAPGGTPYQARTKWMVDVSYLFMLQPGEQFSVRVDQQDIGIIYPNESWAKFISKG
jgi:hypothetical protein